MAQDPLKVEFSCVVMYVCMKGQEVKFLEAMLQRQQLNLGHEDGKI